MNLMYLAWIFIGIAISGICVLIYGMYKEKHNRSNTDKYIDYDYIDTIGRPIKIDSKNGWYIVATTGEIIFEIEDNK